MATASPFPPSRRLLILYGSETGTAADLAHELSRQAERVHFRSTCLCADSFSPPSSLPTYPLVVFVTSTTGQGDMPGNMQSFWKFFLRRKLPADWLGGVQFTTFGCGDSSYAKFNWAVRKVHKRFLQLGAREVAARGEGDEQGREGIDGTFVPWSMQLFKILLEKYPIPAGLTPIPEDQLLPPKYTLEFATPPPINGHGIPRSPATESEDEMGKLHVPRPGSLLGHISHNTRLTPQDHWQDVRHIAIDLPISVPYSPGDTVSILPKNFPEDVNEFIRLQDWEMIADTPLIIQPSPHIPPEDLPPPPIPNPVEGLTLRKLLTHHLDITSIPRRSFFSRIAGFTSDETHKERLLEFTNPEYVDELYDYTTRPRRSILEVLQEFSSVKIELRRLLEVVPVIRERLFSIASSRLGCRIKDESDNNEGELTKNVELLVAIVQYKTVIKKLRRGVCTRWLASLSPGAEINVLFRRGSFKSALREIQKPVVMVGPGTGVAPMRALAWERVNVRERMGRNLLFFGCRNQAADFFFENEWRVLQERGELECWTAFSRDQRQKMYVQTVIREQGKKVFEALVEEEGVVYVCGSSGRMPSAVREALIEVFEKYGGWERDKAEAYLLKMEKSDRYRQETW